MHNKSRKDKKIKKLDIDLINLATNPRLGIVNKLNEIIDYLNNEHTQG
jgi:hypothetical protein